jgi:hypothetical protein
MKTDKQEVAPTTNASATTTTSRIVSTGAVVCLNYWFLIRFKTISLGSGRNKSI